MLQVWEPNTLPLPGVIISEAPKAETKEIAKTHKVREFAIPQSILDINDNFPKGQVIKYFPCQGNGLIKDRNGHEIIFDMSEFDFVGEKGKTNLEIGSHVGYDVSRTGTGLRVKKLKIY